MENPDKLKDNISKLAKEARKGYLLEVDVSYPDNLHDDLPFMWEKRKINGVQKLVSNLYDMKEYIIHTAGLNRMLKHRLVVDDIR